MTESTAMLIVQTALQVVAALGGLGTFGVMIAVAFKMGNWAGRFSTELTQLRTDLVRQNHTDDKLFDLVRGNVGVADCEARHTQLNAELGSVSATMTNHLVGHAEARVGG